MKKGKILFALISVYLCIAALFCSVFAMSTVDHEFQGLLNYEADTPTYRYLCYYNENNWSNVYAYTFGIATQDTKNYIDVADGKAVLVGLGDVWNKGYEMIQNPGNASEYMIRGILLTTGTQVKIRLNTTGWYGCTDVVYEQGRDYIEAGDNDNIQFHGTNGTGIYDFYFRPNDSANNKISIVRHGKEDATTKYSGDWSGTAMTPITSQSNWYYIRVSSDAQWIIFNNGSGSQTSDIMVDLTKKYYKEGVWYASMPS